MGGKCEKKEYKAAIIYETIKLTRITGLLRARRGAPSTTCTLPCTDSNVHAAVYGPGPQGARLSLYFGLNCVSLMLWIRK
jgi:hypothetical protein